MIPSQAGTSYYVAASSTSPNIVQRAPHEIKGFSTRDESGALGRVDLVVRLCLPFHIDES